MDIGLASAKCGSNECVLMVIIMYLMILILFSLCRSGIYKANGKVLYVGFSRLPNSHYCWHM